MTEIRKKVHSSVTRGIFLASGAVSSARIAAKSGFDWILLDMEHGLGSEQETLHQISAIRDTGCAPLVRIPALRQEYIKRVLDFGAAGIMCPMIENVGQAQDFVRAMRYPPRGYRGLTGGSAASDYGFEFKKYFSEINDSLLTVVQIECASAVRDIEKIAQIEEVDVLFIGHSDLSLNLGVYGKFDAPAMLEAEDAVLAAAAKYGKVAGMLLKASMDPELYLAKGFKFIALGTDLGCLKQEFQNMIKKTDKFCI